MVLDWNSGALAEGMACYRRQDFFAAHEYWEEIWVTAAEPEKTFLQALIHVTVALHHAQGGNSVGARRQLSRALRKLESYPAEFCRVPVEQLRASLRTWVLGLENGSTSELHYPQIV